MNEASLDKERLAKALQAVDAYCCEDCVVEIITVYNEADDE